MNPSERMELANKRKQVLRELFVERDGQEAKHGVRNAAERARMSPTGAYLHYREILGEELGEVSKAYLENKPAEIREELVQCAAVIVAMLEYGDRDGWFGPHGISR